MTVEFRGQLAQLPASEYYEMLGEIEELERIIALVQEHCQCDYGHDGMPCKGCQALGHQDPEEK